MVDRNIQGMSELDQARLNVTKYRPNGTKQRQTVTTFRLTSKLHQARLRHEVRQLMGGGDDEVGGNGSGPEVGGLYPTFHLTVQHPQWFGVCVESRCTDIAPLPAVGLPQGSIAAARSPDAVQHTLLTRKKEVRSIPARVNTLVPRKKGAPAGPLSVASDGGNASERAPRLATPALAPAVAPPVKKAKLGVNEGAKGVTRSPTAKPKASGTAKASSGLAPGERPKATPKTSSKASRSPGSVGSKVAKPRAVENPSAQRPPSVPRIQGSQREAEAEVSDVPDPDESTECCYVAGLLHNVPFFFCDKRKCRRLGEALARPVHPPPQAFRGPPKQQAPMPQPVAAAPQKPGPPEVD